jgi:ATP-dependent protease ClpP protease subunit
MKEHFTLKNFGIGLAIGVLGLLLSATVLEFAILFKRQFTQLSQESHHKIKYINEVHKKPNLNLKQDGVTKTEQLVKTVKLEEANTISIQGVINNSSMAKAQAELAEKALLLGSDATIYIVLDSGGGSIFAGLDFIEFARALPNKIITITKFAGSMAFQIAQHLDDRYILDTGVLMSHRARGGVKGQFDGELESRLAFYKDMFNRLESQSAHRMGLELDVYKALIINEFWSTGFRSIENNSADEVIKATCGKSLLGTKTVAVSTFIGTMEVKISKCPLIRGVISTSSNEVYVDEKLNNFILSSFNSPNLFLEKYIVTGKFKQFIGD